MTLATGAVAALVCIGFSVLCLILVGRQEDDQAQARATAGWDRLLPIIKLGRLPAVLPYHRDGPIQVLDAQGRVVAATPRLVGKQPIATLRPTDTGVLSQRTVCHPAGLTGCRTVDLFKVYQPDGIWLIDVAVPSVPWYGNSTVVILVIGGSVLVTAMMAVGVFQAVGKTLTPVDAIRTQLAEITATGLHRRVPVPSNQDEIKFLAETANATLDRLDDAYQQLRLFTSGSSHKLRFTADASHELRSPITAMRAQVEEALMYPDDTDWPRTATAVLAGIERLQAIVIDLLTLAQLDAGVLLTRSPTDLGQLVSAELDRRTCPMEIVKELHQNVAIDCDRLGITRLLANLLDNAERHATSQITVTVRTETVRAETVRAETVRADGLMARLEVIDDGAGIAAEHRESVFDRFTRLDASRSRDAGGTGLGLAIARQIAEAHQGTLTIQDSERGARFVLLLPACDPAQDD